MAAITTRLHHAPPALLRRGPPSNPFLRFASSQPTLLLSRAAATPRLYPIAARGDEDDGDALPNPKPRQRPLGLSPLLVAAVTAAASPQAALALSGGSCGGSDSSSSSSSSSSDDSTTDSIDWSSSTCSSSKPKKKKEGTEATHESVGTADSRPVPPSNMWLWGGIAVMFAAMVVAAKNGWIPDETTSVVKLQVVAKDDQWDSWKEYFDRISAQERSKFDEETLWNSNGVKGEKTYSMKTDGSKNEYVVVTILVAANGTMKLPEAIRSAADLDAVAARLDSTPESDLRGVRVLWTPQDADDVLSEERMRKDYPNLKPLA